MVRFGILGFGLHAVKRLMPGFAIAKNSRVTGLSRRERSQGEESARKYGILHAFDNAEDLCRSSDVDAIFVATPNSLHLHDVLVALKCGKPVLCEKPMGMSGDECRLMVNAARDAGPLLGIAHVFRFEESTARMRERVANGDIGRPVFARSEFSFFGGREHARAWLYDRSLAGGGPIADVGVHCIDSLRYILQEEVLRVTARGSTDADSGDVEAAAVLSLEFSRGTLGSVLVSYRADYRTPLELVGQKGVLFAEDALTVEHPVELHLRQGGKIVEKEKLSNHLAYARQVDTFADAVEGKSKFPIPGEEGWQNQEVLDAAYRSLDSGRTEEVLQVVNSE